MLNKILVFDLSWVVDLIRTNRHVGQDMGNRRRGINRSISRRQRLSGARRIGLERLLG